MVQSRPCGFSLISALRYLRRSIRLIRLRSRNQLWGKARSYLESSLAIRPTPTAYHELGQLMLKLDEPQAATTAFAKGLTLSNAGVPDVPQLERDT